MSKVQRNVLITLLLFIGSFVTALVLQGLLINNWAWLMDDHSDKAAIVLAVMDIWKGISKMTIIVFTGSFIMYFYSGLLLKINKNTPLIHP